MADTYINGAKQHFKTLVAREEALRHRDLGFQPGALQPHQMNNASLHHVAVVMDGWHRDYVTVFNQIKHFSQCIDAVSTYLKYMYERAGRELDAAQQSPTRNQAALMALTIQKEQAHRTWQEFHKDFYFVTELLEHAEKYEVQVQMTREHVAQVLTDRARNPVQ